MARPRSTTFMSVLKALESGIDKPANLVGYLSISRQTVQRKLKSLHEEKLIERTGSGPTARYQLTPLFSPENSFKGGRLCLVIGAKGAGLLQRALEWRARVGFGQLQVFAELVQDGHLVSRRFSTASSTDPQSSRGLMDIYDKVDAICNAIKLDALGLSSGSSMGIHNKFLGSTTKLSWELQSALRHRMGWDWTIDHNSHGLGVWHDSPPENEDFPKVYSQTLPWRAAGETQSKKLDMSNRHYLIEADLGYFQAAHEALQAYARALQGDGTIFHALMSQGQLRTSNGIPVDEAKLRTAWLMGVHLKDIAQNGEVSKPELTQSGNTGLLCELANQIGMHIGLAGKTVNSDVWSFEPTSPHQQADLEAIGEGVEIVTSSRPWIDAVQRSKPENCIVLKVGNHFKVVSSDDASDVLNLLAQSSSLQTAVTKSVLAQKPVTTTAVF